MVLCAERARESGVTAPVVLAALDEIALTGRQTGEDLRTVMQLLRQSGPGLPDRLTTNEDAGLLAALSRSRGRLAHQGITWTLACTGRSPPSPPR